MIYSSSKWLNVWTGDAQTVDYYDNAPVVMYAWSWDYFIYNNKIFQRYSRKYKKKFNDECIDDGLREQKKNKMAYHQNHQIGNAHF